MTVLPRSSRARRAPVVRAAMVMVHVTVERPCVVLTLQVERAAAPRTACEAGFDAPLEPVPVPAPPLGWPAPTDPPVSPGSVVAVPPPAGNVFACPVPVTEAVLTPAAVLLSASVSFALRGPAAFGENRRATSHVPPGWMGAAAHDSDSTEKSVGLAPPSDTPVTTSGLVPVFVSTDLTTSLDVPTSSVPKLASVRVVVIVLKRSTPVGARPRPPGLPPPTSARRSFRRVSVCCLRGRAIVPAGLHASLDGL